MRSTTNSAKKHAFLMQQFTVRLCLVAVLDSLKRLQTAFHHSQSSTDYFSATRPDHFSQTFDRTSTYLVDRPF